MRICALNQDGLHVNWKMHEWTALIKGRMAEGKADDEN